MARAPIIGPDCDESIEKTDELNLEDEEKSITTQTNEGNLKDDRNFESERMH